jgi:murein L,D-transpeptidase YafK
VSRSGAIVASGFGVTLLGAVLLLWPIAGRSLMDSVGVGPTSSRAQAAAARVRPGLERDFHALGLRYGAALFIRIVKAERELELWVEAGDRYVLFRSYPICSYSGDLGPKLRQGDGQAPEGFYSVALGQLNPASRFHLSFNLGYPNAYDRAHGRTGQYLMVHGNCVSIGCYAMGDAAIEEIYTLVEAALGGGQRAVPVHVFPFRMGDARRAEIEASTWREFWENLREGWTAFERDGRPPAVGVSGKRYTFAPGS